MSRMAQAIANHIDCCTKFTPQQTLAILTAGQCTQLSSSVREFRYALILGTQDLNGTANVGNVRFGLGDVDGGEQPIVVAPGQTYVLALPPGAKSDFRDWAAIPDNNGDNLAIIYF